MPCRSFLTPRSCFRALVGTFGLVTTIACDGSDAEGRADAGVGSDVGQVSVGEAATSGDAGAESSERGGGTLVVVFEETTEDGALTVGFGRPTGDEGDAGVTSVVPVGTSGEVDSNPVTPNPPASSSGVASWPPEVSSEATTSEVWSSSGEPASSTIPAPPTTSESTTSESTASADVPSSPPEVNLVVTADWVDLPATVRAEGLPDNANVFLQWQLVSAPEGSEVVGNEWTEERSPDVSFIPDLAGAYTLRLQITEGQDVSELTTTVNVEAVNVAYLRFSPGVDGGYVQSPTMVLSDQSEPAIEVGCSYDNTSFGSTFWEEQLASGERGFAFHYPAVPGEVTHMAYRFREQENPRGVTHVVTAANDCDLNPPTPLLYGKYPAFSPDGGRLARLDDNDQSQLFVSDSKGEGQLPLASDFLLDVTWWNDDAVVWAGQPDETWVPLGYSVPGETSFAEVMNCESAEMRFELFRRVWALSDGLLALEGSNLWRLPVTLQGGIPAASCERTENQLLFEGVVDAAVSADKSMLAVIQSFVPGESPPMAMLQVGPLDDLFGEKWVATELDPSRTYTGLHWIAGAKQIVWTQVELEAWSVEGYYQAEVRASQIHKLNADGTRPRVLAQETPVYFNETLVTTGPLEVGEGYYYYPTEAFVR